MTPIHKRVGPRPGRKAYDFVDPGGIHHCGHGIKRELPPYRHMRIWEMNCGEVRCSLSERDYFLPQFVNEYIDAALDGKNQPGEWLALDELALRLARLAEEGTPV